MPNRKHILVFGDSLTWGIIPGTRERHALNDRWPQVVGAALSEKVRVTTEALPGRTTVWDEPFRDDRNGKKSFFMLLQSHAPVDLVVLMLGVNDLQTLYPAGAVQAAKGVGLMAQQAINHIGDGQAFTPKVLIVSSPLLVESDNAFDVMVEAVEDVKNLAAELQKVSVELGCGFFDVTEVCKASEDDGIHLDKENTIALGKALVAPISEILEI